MAGRKAEPIGALLPTVLQRAKQRHTALLALQRRWPALVGRRLARHSAPVSLRRGRLVVLVDGPGETFVLSYQKAVLLKRLQEGKTPGVEEIVLRPGSQERALPRRAGCRT